MENKSISTKKEFYDFLVSDKFKSKDNEKTYYSAFSKIARNRWTAEIDGDRILVSYSKNGWTASMHFWKTNMLKASPFGKLKFTKIVNSNGLEVGVNATIRYILKDNGDYESKYIRDISTLMTLRNVKEVFGSVSDMRRHLFENHPKAFKEIRFQNTYLLFVLNDVGIYKKGMIINKHLSYSDTEYENLREPSKVYEDTNFMPTFSLCCHLKEDSNIDRPTPKSCHKREFGCSNGCLTHCRNKSANNLDTLVYNKLVELKELL
jgi:hypothetical protein